MAKRKTRTRPPRHSDQEQKIRLAIDEPEALYLGGIWVSPGEEAWVPAHEAGKLLDAGRAVEVKD